MRYALILGLVTAFLLANSGQAPGQSRPYAPKAAVPSEPTNDAFLQIEIRTVKAAEIPTMGEVEAPAYPGALVIQTIPPRTRVKGGKTTESLPVVILFTTDPVRRVVDFYMENLGGWSHTTYLSSHYFWFGLDEFNPFGESGRTTPSLQVMEARTSKLVPDALTEIHVRYKPRRRIQG
jgi:hypothetical protein